jgi:hypothetical protein
MCPKQEIKPNLLNIKINYGKIIAPPFFQLLKPNMGVTEIKN